MQRINSKPAGLLRYTSFLVTLGIALFLGSAGTLQAQVCFGSCDIFDTDGTWTNESWLYTPDPLDRNGQCVYSCANISCFITGIVSYANATGEQRAIFVSGVLIKIVDPGTGWQSDIDGVLPGCGNILWFAAKNASGTVTSEMELGCKMCSFGIG